MPGRKRIKLGVISNEFFELSLGRMGGFGWATRQIANCFNRSYDLNVDLVFISGEIYSQQDHSDPVVHDTRLILREHNRLNYCKKIWKEKIDILLSIDYRRRYRDICRLLPRTPIIVWVRDPRPPEDVTKIGSVRIPGADGVQPQGLKSPDCTSLAGVVRASKWWRRPVLFATTTPFLGDKVPGTYGLQPTEVAILPNIIDIAPGEIVKSAKPSIVFLARLDPYKRPWLFVEVARHFPEVEFIFLGQSHFRGEGAWEANLLPDNVKLMGHVGEEKKTAILSAAWVLVNTSIHEGLAVSFLEALRCETPLLSCVDPENVVSRFGIYVGRYDGTGMEAIPKYVDGLTRLLEQKELRLRLGKEGSTWVRETHNKRRFLEAFFELVARAAPRKSRERDGAPWSQWVPGSGIAE